MALMATGATKASESKQRAAGINYYNRRQDLLRKDGDGSTLSKSDGTVIDVNRYFKVGDSLPDYINAFNKEDLKDLLLNQDFNMYGAAIRLLESPIPNAYKYIKALKEMVFRLSQMSLVNERLFKMCLSEADRLSDGVGERNGKRWTEVDDETLIEMASQEGTTILDLSRVFGRTPGAIQSRITHLVGIRRISKAVAGKFIGTFNGVETEGVINGMVTSS